MITLKHSVELTITLGAAWLLWVSYVGAAAWRHKLTAAAEWAGTKVPSVQFSKLPRMAPRNRKRGLPTMDYVTGQLAKLADPCVTCGGDHSGRCDYHDEWHFTGSRWEAPLTLQSSLSADDWLTTLLMEPIGV